MYLIAGKVQDNESLLRLSSNEVADESSKVSTLVLCDIEIGLDWLSGTITSRYCTSTVGGSVEVDKEGR